MLEMEIILYVVVLGVSFAAGVVNASLGDPLGLRRFGLLPRL